MTRVSPGCSSGYIPLSVGTSLQHGWAEVYALHPICESIPPLPLCSPRLLLND